MPSGDTQEQFLRLTGSRTHAKSHHMERAMSELALQVKGLIFQWYDAPTRFKLFGFQGTTERILITIRILWFPILFREYVPARNHG
jgi:hypothetical protein